MVVPVSVPSMYKIELFNHLILCKQITDFKRNFQCFIAIDESIQLWSNEIIGV